eukprot:456767-Prorocentrum_minimum.AAC.1
MDANKNAGAQKKTYNFVRSDVPPPPEELPHLGLISEQLQRTSINVTQSDIMRLGINPNTVNNEHNRGVQVRRPGA